MPTTVLLIRHPESDWNRQGIYQGQKDIPLSPLGCHQAELVATRLCGERISGIICSPLERAKTLACAIGRPHGIVPREDDRLTEIAHGPWEGLSRQQVAEQFPDLYQTWTERPHEVTFPEGESLHDVAARSVQVVDELLQREGDELWVVVTHDTVCRLVVTEAHGHPIDRFGSVELENAGITTLEGDQLLGSVKHVNDVTHLGEHRVDIGVQAL